MLGNEECQVLLTLDFGANNQAGFVVRLLGTVHTGQLQKKRSSRKMAIVIVIVTTNSMMIQANCRSSLCVGYGAVLPPFLAESSGGSAVGTAASCGFGG